jgi:hypothetical protein
MYVPNGGIFNQKLVAYPLKQVVVPDAVFQAAFAL